MTQFEKVQTQLDEFCAELERADISFTRDQAEIVIEADYDLLGDIVDEFYTFIEGACLCPIGLFNGKVTISLPNLYDF